MASKEEAAMFDAAIEAFLRLVSPFMLHAATHKALEYLIRQFKINQFNYDAVLLNMLAFHETNVFVRMLQIVDVRCVLLPFL